MQAKAGCIGLISDTHGLLRPQALAALDGSDLIIHAGDVGKPEILSALKRLAPVVAVRGNVDTSPWADALPEAAVAEAGSVQLYVLHDVQALDLDPAAAGFQVVVSGHSHQPGKFERNGVLYIKSGKCRSAQVSIASVRGPPELGTYAVPSRVRRTEGLIVSSIRRQPSASGTVPIFFPLVSP